jgi:menaquinone-dependent protoporphyrinogen IX oxidase
MNAPRRPRTKPNFAGPTQYVRLVHRCRTKASLIYRRTKNRRAVQLPLGYTNWNEQRYLGTEGDDVIEMAEQTDI